MFRDDELIVYHFDGSGEMAPPNAKKLVMNTNTEVLPDGFCQFLYKMQEVELSEKLKAIGPNTFYGTALREFKVTRKVKMIGLYFYY